ncbi:MAG: tyrosine-protein phosphatase [Bacillota bacterium]|nr:tyrosine-protein phosphatase [Bacillota bacterium]
MYKPEIILEGAPNARDLGGLETVDGRKVKANRLIRSGNLHRISDADAEYLKKAGLRKVVDLRTAQERREKPDRVIDGVYYIVCPIMPDRVEGITRETPKTEAEEAKRMIAMAKHLMSRNSDGRTQMKSLYPLFVSLDHCVEHFAEFFRILLDTEDGAVLFHCTMGKDRAGTAAALALYALGVSRESIVKDYLITAERCAPGTKHLIEGCRKFTNDEAVLEFIYRLDTVEEDFINTSFETVEQLYGGMDNFLKDKLGMDSEKINRLRDLYLE